MRTVGSRRLDPGEHTYLSQFAEKVPAPFEVTYDSDSFTFQVSIRFTSVQTISQEALTGSFIDIIPIAIRRQLEEHRFEVMRLLRELCAVHELPNSLVTRDQYLKYMEVGK